MGMICFWIYVVMITMLSIMKPDAPLVGKSISTRLKGCDELKVSVPSGKTSTGVSTPLAWFEPTAWLDVEPT